MNGDELPSAEVLAFLRRHHTIDEQLSRLLDIGPNEHRAPSLMELRLAQQYQNSLRLAWEGEAWAGIIQTKLWILTQNLQSLKESRPSIFEQYREKFHEVDHDQYFGWRCEIEVAAFLVRNGIAFTHPDPPDFQFDWNHETVKIECTSGHFKTSTRPMKEKLKAKIIDKSGKDYSNPSTLLIIEITNLIWNALRRDEDISGQVKHWASECIENFELPIGSVMLITLKPKMDDMFIEEGVRKASVEVGVDRIDNPIKQPNGALLEFLDEYFPFGEGGEEALWIPPEL